MLEMKIYNVPKEKFWESHHLRHHDPLHFFRNWYYVTSAVGQPGFVPRNYMQETSATPEEKTSHCQKVKIAKMREDNERNDVGEDYVL